jgi:hypothetical protein
LRAKYIERVADEVAHILLRAGVRDVGFMGMISAVTNMRAKTGLPKPHDRVGEFIRSDHVKKVVPLFEELCNGSAIDLTVTCFPKPELLEKGKVARPIMFAQYH